MLDYDVVIGLEIHAELKTKTKVFCSCKNEFGSSPNTNTCPVCTGMPGALPIINKKAVELCIKAGLCFGCSISEYAVMERKNFFYPDLSKAYQISQMVHPICVGGQIQLSSGKITRLNRIHLEEDAGKLTHISKSVGTLIDYNRGGTPLIEIVTEPDFSSAEEVDEFLKRVREALVFAGIADCKMEEGGMRCDVNLSLKPKGSTVFGTRTEMKNLNSFKAIARAIEGERARQIELLEEGKQVIQETRRWDDNKEYSYAMRSKEDAQDYRYFPDPDLVPVIISDEWLNEVKAKQPELQAEKKERYKKEFDIPEYDIDIITGSKHMADIFEETISLGANPKKVSNWLMVETMRLLKEHEMEPEDIKFSATNLAKLIQLTDEKAINSTVAKEVFEQIFNEDIDPVAYVEEKGLKTVNDEGALRSTIEQVIANNPQSVEDYKSGKKKAIGFLVGQTMKEMKGKADPSMINQILVELLQ